MDIAHLSRQELMGGLKKMGDGFIDFSAGVPKEEFLSLIHISLLPLLLFPSSAPMRSAVPISPRPELEVVCVLLWPVSSSVKRDSSDDSPPEEVLFVFVSVLIRESITSRESCENL